MSGAPCICLAGVRNGAGTLPSDWLTATDMPCADQYQNAVLELPGVRSRGGRGGLWRTPCQSAWLPPLLPANSTFCPVLYLQNSPFDCDTALSLYDLEHFELFWEKTLVSKGWGCLASACLGIIPDEDWWWPVVLSLPLQVKLSCASSYP